MEVKSWAESPVFLKEMADWPQVHKAEETFGLRQRLDRNSVSDEASVLPSAPSDGQNVGAAEQSLWVLLQYNVQVRNVHFSRTHSFTVTLAAVRWRWSAELSVLMPHGASRFKNTGKASGSTGSSLCQGKPENKKRRENRNNAALKVAAVHRKLHQHHHRWLRVAKETWK